MAVDHVAARAYVACDGQGSRDRDRTVDVNGPVIAEFQRGARPMDQPELASRRRGRVLRKREGPSDDNAVLGVPFLREDEDLVAG